jgi:hypothetical protein
MARAFSGFSIPAFRSNLFLFVIARYEAISAVVAYFVLFWNEWLGPFRVFLFRLSVPIFSYLSLQGTKQSQL